MGCRQPLRGCDCCQQQVEPDGRCNQGQPHACRLIPGQPQGWPTAGRSGSKELQSPRSTAHPDEERAETVIAFDSEGWCNHRQADRLQSEKTLKRLHHQQAADCDKRDTCNNGKDSKQTSPISEQLLLNPLPSRLPLNLPLADLLWLSNGFR